MNTPVKTPSILKSLFPGLIWKINTSEKKIFLTFDDGPIDIVTPYVLNVLKDYNAKATFFCIGDNIRKHPDTFAKILEEGHSIGNHTYNHLSGWKTNIQHYIDNIEKCENLLKKSQKLFRPPYGRIGFLQLKVLKRDYRIIMWDILTADYSGNLNCELRLQQCIDNTENGSIVVFHDSLKAFENLKLILPAYLDYFTTRNYSFEAIRYD